MSKYVDEDGALYAVKNTAPSFVESHTGKVTTQREIKINVAPQTPKDLGDMESYLLNTNRLAALYSKTGPPAAQTNTNVVARDLIKDAANDYAVDHDITIEDATRMSFVYFQEVLHFVNIDVKSRL